MSRRARMTVGTVALAGLAALLFWSFAGLPGFGGYRGPYGTMLNRVAVPERHTTNVVAATVFDYRGFDTLGEEFILFAAVLGVVLLLRSDRSERDEAAEAQDGARSAALVAGGVVTLGGAVLVALWLVAGGYVTPGGGFQGGVALAGGLLLLHLVSGHGPFRPFGDERALDPVEATGAGGYAAIGLAALVTGAPFLHNLMGLGHTGTLWSAGSIPLLNWAAALEVAAANLVLFTEFLDEHIVPLARRQA